MAVRILIDWIGPSESVDLTLEGKFTQSGDEDGLIAIHTDSESVFVNSDEIQMLRVLDNV